jgi:hypothetical protein
MSRRPPRPPPAASLKSPLGTTAEDLPSLHDKHRTADKGVSRQCAALRSPAACAFVADRTPQRACAFACEQRRRPGAQHGTRRLCIHRGGVGVRCAGGRPLATMVITPLTSFGDVQVGRRARRNCRSTTARLRPSPRVADTDAQPVAIVERSADERPRPEEDITASRFSQVRG